MYSLLHLIFCFNFLQIFTAQCLGKTLQIEKFPFLHQPHGPLLILADIHSANHMTAAQFIM